MKYALKFGGGALTFFGGMALLSLVIFLSDILQQPVSDQLLSFVSLFGPALVMSAICAASFWLGVVRLGRHAGTDNPYLFGILSALVIYAAFAVMALLVTQLSRPASFLTHVLIALLVCLLAASKFGAARR